MSAARKPALAFIFITLLLDVIGFGIIIPVLPKLITHLTGEPLSAAARYGGWMGFAFAGMQFLFSPVLGNLSDKYGRRPVLLVALFGFGLDYLFLAFAPSIGWLFVGRMIAGITGASFTTAGAYIADISTPENRAKNFGLIGAAFGLGFIIGPVLGGKLVGFGAQVPFLVAAGLTFLNWLYGFFVLPESLAPENRRPFSWSRANPIGSLLLLRRYPVILGMVGSLVLVYIAAHATQSTWSYYTMYKFHWSESRVGDSLGVVGLLTALVQGVLIRYLNPKLGAARSVFVGLGFYAIGFLLFSVAPTGWMMFAFLIPYCLGGIAGPALQGIMSGQVPPTEQGELQGALTSLVSLTSIVGPPLMTNLFSYFTSPAAPVHFLGAPFLTGAVLTVGSLLLALRSLRRYQPEVSAPLPADAEVVAGH
ncbi:TCR/Tet family MFS transporter [Hymenobacter psychrotolerans]|uniref:MFS transporter, DHA1 family, tetracycline resistance protein n=1 Tax=Hymenobacter psychrotolerans DSM 18569 TaxID=1121959 RepID=A0A1M6UJ63_9BACT|nr:TCR/Tet family MFS transporter [Hymenobacter psychrotolerans]SHK69221.1 MFS transporter, DHA1 family, tetracycline resistance protein [Hymenobacter psychrotolerans DSM 18569]